MRRFELSNLRSPADRSLLTLSKVVEEDGQIIRARLVDSSGRIFSVRDGIPDLIYPFPEVRQESVKRSQDFYNSRAEAYDENLHLTFFVHNENELELRNRFVDALELQPESKVLEIAAGTGRDSEVIVQRLSLNGLLCVQDLAAGMLERCREKLRATEVPVSCCLSNACFLPYPDHYFDAVYSFGGLGEFPDIRRALSEMVRVAKPGAKVVVGDESIPPWLRNTEFARILSTTNPQFLAELPLGEMPVEARDVRLRWVIGGVFYLIDFRVGCGEPVGNFDFPIPGARGGTLRTRYEGQLEGVTSETKRLAHLAREKRGLSMHDWLDEIVRCAAERDLKDC